MLRRTNSKILEKTKHYGNQKTKSYMGRKHSCGHSPVATPDPTEHAPSPSKRSGGPVWCSVNGFCRTFQNLSEPLFPTGSALSSECSALTVLSHHVLAVSLADLGIQCPHRLVPLSRGQGARPSSALLECPWSSIYLLRMPTHPPPPCSLDTPPSSAYCIFLALVVSSEFFCMGVYTHSLHFIAPSLITRKCLRQEPPIAEKKCIPLSPCTLEGGTY